MQIKSRFPSFQMDPLSITEGSISIIHLCARSTISLSRWPGTKQTTNEQIYSFCGEIRALSATYDALNNKLRSPAMASAAQSGSSGGGLWQHIAMSIKDCENTMVLLNEILNKFSLDSADLYQQTYQLFSGSLRYGDLSRLRQRVPIFDNFLAFLPQLIATNRQLKHKLVDEKQQKQLNAKIDYLEERLDRIKTALDVYSQSADTFVAANWTYEDDSKMYKNLNGCISALRTFLADASVRSRQRPRANTIVPVIQGTGPTAYLNPEDLLSQQDSLLDSWVQAPVLSSQPLSEPHSPMDVLSPTVAHDGFLRREGETGGGFGWAHDALRSGETSVPNDPFLDSTSRMRSSINSSSTASAGPELRAVAGTQEGRELSGHAQVVISSRFFAIGELCARNDHEKAASEAIDFLKTYTPNAPTIPHESEIRNNVIKNDRLGLAGTGHGYAPIHFFVSLPTECAYEVSLLIDNGIDVNGSILAQVTDSRSRTPCHNALQLAAERGHSNIISLLASCPSADLEAVDSRGLTPLFIAWRKGHLKCVEVLLTHGALSAGSPNTWSGNSLLHGAAWLCNIELVRLLLALGADVNARNAAGSTPLIAAVISTEIGDARLRRKKAANCVPVMRMLLDAGANFRMRNLAGHTAMYYAERERNVEAVTLLEGRGASRAIVEAHPLHPPDVVVRLFKRMLTSPPKPQPSAIRRARTMST